MAEDVPAVASAVRLLERIAEDWPEPVAPGTLVKELGINRSTCYNILGTLQRSGWTSSQGQRSGWSLGPRLLSLTGVPAEAVTTIIQRELDDLARRLGFVVFVVQRASSGQYSVLAKAERGQGVRVTISPGDTFPFSAPAIMQAFHAWGCLADFDRLVRRYGVEKFTPRTVTDLGGVHKGLRECRDHGYGTSVGEYDLAQSGVAAPVFGTSGRVSAVLCSLAFSSELDESNVAEIGRLVRGSALRITEQTGARAPDGAADRADRTTGKER
ncbi:MAG: IclR family transcriptional regulator [Sciscionella sp.]